MYKKLQKRAKELGLPFAGVSTNELKSSIKAKELELKDAPKDTDGENGPSTPPIIDSPKDEIEEPKDEIEEPKKVIEEEDSNTGIVTNSEGKVARVYSQFQHGDNFKELTTEYAKARGFSFKFVKDQDGIICPACGHRFAK